MKKLLQSLFLLLFVVSHSMAQVAKDRTITGTVTAKEDGLPLPGVSVKIVGGQTGALTAADGKYSIKISAGATALEFSSVGYVSQKRPIGASNIINVVLEPDEQLLSEVVVVAFGKQKKEAVTGSIAQIGEKDLNQRPITNLSNALAGVAPGIQTNAGSGQPGAGATVRIRGFG
ncbi:MAG TPA: carboxypeptidase-like regulatory domain-containing protein, partial [Daejeonella sp.]|nr:carboxypeptidase-like regulatory domain-containing protein [Daejeonella sp.]